MRTVLITGANRGIGLATCKILKKKSIKLLVLQDLRLKTFQANLLNVTFLVKKKLIL